MPTPPNPPARDSHDSVPSPFLHRFGSALNHHVHLHACVTDGVFVPAAAEAGGDSPPAFLPVRPITQADLAALTARVRRRVIRWFRLARLLDAAAAADMLALENSGFSVDASVRITLIDRDVPSYFESLEHLLRVLRPAPLRSIGTATTECSRRITGSGKPSRRWQSGMSASHAMPHPLSLGERVGVRVLQPRVPDIKSPARTTPHGSPGPSSWRG